MAELFANPPPLNDRWTGGLRELGHETLEILLGVPELRRRWAEEFNQPEPADEIEFAIAQLRAFRPEILLLRDHLAFSPGDIDRLREGCPTLRAVLGWVGAPPMPPEVIGRFDGILSCMVGYVAECRDRGISAHLVHHAFEPAWLEGAEPQARDIPLSFIGSVYGLRGLHETRQMILERMVATFPMQAFGQLHNQGPLYMLKSAAKSVLWPLRSGLSAMGVGESVLQRLPLLRAAKGPSRVMPVSRRLRAATRGPVWGAEMHRILARSLMTWNCHIDAAGPFAANIRLFEATGWGCCLVTDAKRNLPEMFEPDREVVTYASADECLEKVRWLLDHPDEARRIGAAGQARCLAQHTYSHRAHDIDAAIRAVL